MKKLKQLLLILTLCLSFQGFSQEQVKYEYLSIKLYNPYSHIDITIGTKEHLVIEFEKEKSKFGDSYTPFFEQIEKYQDQGWEVYSMDIDQALISSIMRRKKE